MFALLQILAIFLFVVALFFASLKIADFIFATQVGIKPNYMKVIFVIFSFLLWFGVGLATTFLVSLLLVKFPLMKTEAAKVPESKNVAIEAEDCPKIIDTIYLTENQIYQVENHRYIEEVSPIFTIKIEYKKGAKELESAAEQYKSLEVAENTRYYSEQIAQSLENKAKLFQERSDSQKEKKGIKELISLLEKMDTVTKQRQNLINTVEKQCNL